MLKGFGYDDDHIILIVEDDIANNPSISIHDLYYELATHTTGSHAGLYNDACYGNVYRSTLAEFLLR